MTDERRKADRRVPPSVAQHVIEERAQLLERISGLEAEVLQWRANSAENKLIAESLSAELAELEERCVQGGEREAVEVVAYLNPARGYVAMYGPIVMDWDDEHEQVEQLMTVAQHSRIVAAITAQQGASVAVPDDWKSIAMLADQLASMVLTVDAPECAKRTALVMRQRLDASTVSLHLVENPDWVLVPPEATPEMLKPWAASIHGPASYRAMLAAAPKPATLSPASDGVVVSRELLDSHLKKLACHPGMLFTPIPGLLKTYDELRDLLAQHPAPSPVSGLVEALKKIATGCSCEVTTDALDELIAACKAAGGDV